MTAGFATLIIVLGSLGHWTEGASVTPSLFSVEPSSSPNTSVASSNAPRRSILASHMSATFSASMSTSSVTQLSTISASFTAPSTSDTTQPESMAPSSKTMSSSESSASKASSTPNETNVARSSGTPTQPEASQTSIAATSLASHVAFGSSQSVVSSSKTLSSVAYTLPSLASQVSFHLTGSSFVQIMEKVSSESPATESSSINESASSTPTATIYTHSSVILLTSEGVLTSPIPPIPRLTSSLPSLEASFLISPLAEASVTPSLFSVEPSSASNTSVASSNAPRRSISASNMSAQASVSISSSGMNSTESNITISPSSTDSTATSYNSKSTRSATNTATTSSAVNSPASSSTSKSESTFSASISTSSVTQLSTISASFTARSTSNTTQPDSIAPSSKTLSSSESSASKASSTPNETNVARPSIPTLISSLPGLEASFLISPLAGFITHATPSSTPSSASTPASQTPSSGPTTPPEGKKTVIMEVKLDIEFSNKYNDINSPEYKNLETVLKTNLTKVYKHVDGFVDVRILLITKGSVICNYVVILAKNSAVTEDKLKDILLNAGKETFPFKVQSVTLVRTEKSPKETLPHWALVTMIVLGVLAFVFIVVAICACVKYRKYKEPYYLSSGEIDMQSFEAVGYGNMRAKADVNASTAQRRLVASHTNPAYGTKGNLDD